MEKNFAKNKLRRRFISENLDMYEIKMTFFESGDPEDLLLFLQNFNMMFDASGTLTPNTKLQYLHTPL